MNDAEKLYELLWEIYQAGYQRCAADTIGAPYALHGLVATDKMKDDFNDRLKEAINE